MVYVGVDLHRKTFQVVALDHQGAVLLTRRVGSHPQSTRAPHHRPTRRPARAPPAAATGATGRAALAPPT